MTGGNQTNGTATTPAASRRISSIRTIKRPRQRRTRDIPTWGLGPWWRWGWDVGDEPTDAA
jgi:hypothetical protein